MELLTRLPIVDQRFNFRQIERPATGSLLPVALNQNIDSTTSTLITAYNTGPGIVLLTC